MADLRDERRRSVSRACRTVGITRAGFRYVHKRKFADEPIRAAITDFATRFPRRGLPGLQDWIRKTGHEINHKRTARIYREMGMQVKKRKRKRLAPLVAPEGRLKSRSQILEAPAQEQPGAPPAPGEIS